MGATKRAGTIALLGRPNVGKSTLLNAAVGEPIAITSAHPQTTRDRIAGIVTRGASQLVFLDTPGIHRPRHRLGERMNELATSAASECDVAIFMTSASALGPGADDGRPRAHVRGDDQQIVASIPEGKPTVLVVNKIDRVARKDLLFPLLEAYAALRDFAAVVPVSARTGDGVDRVLGAVEELLPEGEPLFPPDELSDKPLRFFVSEYVREQILRRTRQEVPYGVAVAVESFEEGPRGVRVAVTIHVPKDSHKAILIGDGGAMLGAIGAAARKRAAALIGREVHLSTFVRVTPGWHDDVARLAELGYAREPGAARRDAKKARAGQAARARMRRPT